MNKKYGFIVALFFLVSCAGAPGSFTKSDLAISTFTVQQNFQAVYRNVQTGVKKCNEFRSDGDLFTDINEAEIDLYLPDLFGAKSPWVYGFVKIKALSENSSKVSVEVNKAYDAPLLGPSGKGRQRISNWAKGLITCDFLIE